MRTRIALVAIIAVAIMTVSTPMQAATEQSAPSKVSPSSGAKPSAPIALSPDQLAAYRGLTSRADTAPSGLLVDPNGVLFSDNFTQDLPGVAPATAVAIPGAPITGSYDTVTPEKRAEWERVAMCEEGGDWASNGPKFSGGLGISRANWVAFGGQRFAPEGAMATEDQQIMVAESIQSSPPDQPGCHGW